MSPAMKQAAAARLRALVRGRGGGGGGGRGRGGAGAAGPRGGDAGGVCNGDPSSNGGGVGREPGGSPAGGGGSAASAVAPRRPPVQAHPLHMQARPRCVRAPDAAGRLCRFRTPVKRVALPAACSRPLRLCLHAHPSLLRAGRRLPAGRAMTRRCSGGARRRVRPRGRGGRRRPRAWCSAWAPRLRPPAPLPRRRPRRA